MALRRRTLPRALRPALALAPLTVALLTVAGGAAPAAGDARESYRNALNALADQRYDDALELLHEALAERAEERAPGLGRRAYYPHFYLGVALAETGDCRGALAAWEESERQGQIRKDAEEGPALARRRQVCEDRIEELDAARTSAEQALARARKAAGALAELRRAAELAAVWTDGEPSFADREAATLRDLEAAAAELRAAGRAPDTAPFKSAKAKARLVASELDVLADEARERLGEERASAQSALELLASREADAHAALRGVEALRPLPPELDRRATHLEGLLRQVTRRKASAPPDELARFDRELRAAVRDLRQAAKRPPESLVEAVEAFLDGRYASTLAALDGEPFEADSRVAAQVCLLRSASRFALWVLGGAASESAAELEAEIVACGDRVAVDEISTRFFSPRFIRFYGEVLAATPASEPDQEP